MKFKNKIFIILFFASSAFLFINIKFVSAKILLPNGPSNDAEHTQWFTGGSTCEGGASSGIFSEVNEYPINNESTFNCVKAVDQKQFFNFTDNTNSGTVDGIGVVVYAKAETAPAENLRIFLRINDSDFDPGIANDCVLNSTEYTRCFFYWDKNPSNSLAWSLSDLTNLEAGFKTVANGAWDGAEHRVTQIFLDIDFKVDTKKTKYHLMQKILPVNGAVDDSFDFSIADQIDEVRSAFIEIKGIAGPINPLNLGVTVNDSASTPGAYDSTYSINANGRPTYFKVIYDVTDYFKSFVNASGTYSRYLHLNTDSNVYLLNAKLTVVYTWIPELQATGSYQIEGDLTSAIFDTGASEGAAYNSILWKGALGGPGLNQGKVRFQLATSDNNSGPWSYIGSDGVSCGGGFWYEGAADTPIELKCYSNLNNKRYFRYKIQICSDDCSAGGNYTPTVNDVIISWSP